MSAGRYVFAPTKDTCEMPPLANRSSFFRWLETTSDRFVREQWRVLKNSELAPLLPGRSTRFVMWLISSRTTTIAGLLAPSDAELHRYPNLGRVTIAEINRLRSALIDQQRAIDLG